MAMRYAHCFELDFTITTDEPDWEKVPFEKILAACEQRLVAGHSGDLFEYIDTFEFNDPEEV